MLEARRLRLKLCLAGRSLLEIRNVVPKVAVSSSNKVANGPAARSRRHQSNDSGRIEAGQADSLSRWKLFNEPLVVVVVVVGSPTRSFAPKH